MSHRNQCAFGSWVPERMQQLRCTAEAVGSCVREDGEVLRMCAEHGPIFAGYGRFYGGAWTADDQRVHQFEFAL